MSLFKAPTPIKIELLHHAASLGRTRVAIDGGAYVGDWTNQLAGIFDFVHAFEPAPDTLKILRERAGHHTNVEIHPAALFDKSARVDILQRRRKPTSRYVVQSPKGTARAIALDSLSLPNCDFIKLDLEGGELAALIGAQRTISRFRPTIIVEMIAFDGAPAPADVMAFLSDLGYLPELTIDCDTVFRWRG